MLDSLTFLSAVSLAAGTVALVATFVSVVVAGWLSIQQRPLNQVAHITFGLTQLALMAQMMTAVLLLALDMTQLQSLVYYLAGFTAVAGFMLFYWWPTTVTDPDHINRKTRRAMVAAVAAFLLAVTGLTIGADVAYAGQETTAVVPLQIKEFSATTWTARPEQTVLCLGCDTAEGTELSVELNRLEAFSQAELVRFTGQASPNTLNADTATEPELETDDSAQLIQPVYTLIAFMRLNQ